MSALPTWASAHPNGVRPVTAPERPEGRPPALRVVLALLAVYIIWGSTYLGIRIALVSFPPFLMAGSRFLVAGTLLYTAMRWRGAPRPTRAEWAGAALIGVLLIVGGNGGVTFAEQWVPSGLAALGVATVPVWTAVFGGVWGRWPRALEWAGLALGLVGVALLVREQDLSATPIGTAFLIGASMSWAFGSAMSHRTRQPRGLVGASAQMLAGGAALLALSLASGERIPGQVTVSAVAAWCYLSLFGSIVAFSAYNYLLATVRPALATSYAYVNPAVAVALGVGLAGERITGWGLSAMVVILAGVALTGLGQRRFEKPVESVDVTSEPPDAA